MHAKNTVTLSQNMLQGHCTNIGVDHGGGQGDKSPPQNLERGTLMQSVPPRFCHIGTKMSVLWPSKYAKIRLRPGLCSGPRCGSPFGFHIFHSGFPIALYTCAVREIFYSG